MFMMFPIFTEEKTQKKKTNHTHYYDIFDTVMVLNILK